jgi:hypothetical protein
MAERWAGVQKAILADPQCGSVPGHRWHAVKVLERVCHFGLSVVQIERIGDVGRRNVIGRRLRAALDCAADYFGVLGSAEGRIRSVNLDAPGALDAVAIAMDIEAEQAA